MTFVNRACSSGVTSHVLNDRVMDSKVESIFVPTSRPSADDVRRELTRRNKCVSKWDDEFYTLEVIGEISFGDSTSVDVRCTRTIRKQIASIGKDTDLVVFTFGGNDVRFSDIVKQCFAVGYRDPGDCRGLIDDATDLLPEVERRFREDVFAPLRGALRADARVALLSYPYLEKSDDYTLTSLLRTDTYRAGAELRSFMRKADDTQRRAATSANTTAGEAFLFFVDEVKARFAGREPDGSASRRNPNRWIHEFDSKILNEWYHPNPKGHEELAKLLVPYGTFGATGGLGSAISSLDLVFVVDTTGSMGDDIAAVKDFSSQLVNDLSARTRSFRFALVTYRDHPSHTGDSSDYPSRVELGFTDNKTDILNEINAMSVDGGGDFPESVYAGLSAGIGLPWRPGVKKVVIQLGDAPPHDPEPVSGLRADDIVRAAIAVDPAEVYPVNVSSGSVSATLQDIANRTGGQVFSASSPSQVAEALAAVIDAALRKPYAWAGGPYVATIGTPFVLDAFGSFDADGTITTYEWDLDGNGTYETRSSEPAFRHTFADDFDGIVAVRVTDNDGQSSVGTVRAHASLDGDEVPATEDNCPTTPNHGQEDEDGDGIGDACDDTPGFPTEDKPGVMEVDASQVDLSIAKTANRDTAIPSFEVTYTLTVTNPGPGEATSVVVTDDLPEEVTFTRFGVTSGFTCQVNPGVEPEATCTRPSLPPGSYPIEIVVTVPPDAPVGGTVTNRAELSAGVPDPSMTNNSAVRSMTIGGCTITGTNGPDALVGTPGDDVICGLGGDDRIAGLGGNDIIIGGSGNDRIDGGDGNDTISGGSGDDDIVGGAGDDQLHGDAGRDRLVGGTGTDALDGGDGSADQCLPQGGTTVACEVVA